MKKQTWRTTRKEHISGSRPLALLLLLIGLFLIAAGAWPLGLIIFIVGIFADSKHQRRHICCYCGNTVTATSLMCPACHADESTSEAEATAAKAEKAHAAAAKKHPHLHRQK